MSMPKRRALGNAHCSLQPMMMRILRHGGSVSPLSSANRCASKSSRRKCISSMSSAFDGGSRMGISHPFCTAKCQSDIRPRMSLPTPMSAPRIYSRTYGHRAHLVYSSTAASNFARLDCSL